MGYMRHHAIIVTSWDSKTIDKAYEHALSIFSHNDITEILISDPNFYRSFMIGPDGSKEGWAESDRGDKNRAEFIAWVKKQVYDDGSSSLAWCEVQYGDEDGDDYLIQSSARTDDAVNDLPKTSPDAR